MLLALSTALLSGSLVGCLAQSSANATSANVTLPIFAPPTSQPLSNTLLSFSIEQDRWPDWTGIDSRNEFTHAALSNLAELTGRPPKIRVGANSEDKTVWDPTVTVNVDEFPPPNTVTPYPEATHIAVGNEFYVLSQWLPSGTHMTWGVNLGLDNATNALNMANAILNAFLTSVVQESGVVLDLIEIGNEPDLYSNNGLRPSTYNVDDYVPDWINISTPVAQAIQSHPLSRRSDPGSRSLVERSSNTVQGPVQIQACSFAGQGFTPTEVFGLGLLNSTPGELVTVVSQHRYSAAFCQGGDFPLVSFMSKSAVRSNLTLFEDDIAATVQEGLVYILGETGSIACHGAPGVSNTAGAALWVVDYTLFASTIGIGELYFHEGVGFKYNFIQPISLNRSTIDGSPLDPPSPPHIQPSYYAALLIDTLISPNSLSFPWPFSHGTLMSPSSSAWSSARIVELTVPLDNVSGYAAYDAGVLRRAVFVNLDAWLSSMDTAGAVRPIVHLDLGFVLPDVATPPAAGGASVSSFANAMMQVRRLVVDHADDLSNLTWAGQSYEQTSDVSPSGPVVVESVPVAQGIDIRSSEALLIEFEF
ncbi:glycoside hydrolase family 79 protein [Phanerochaete carnosa HHB-10118-sp]|uniref:Glycoside hydrolase family 79 protein n=1 Tax=Phanerochaete carnosa (strain HHB-10118-sp) TaxID=650164 RepID=K5W4B4_PHACS|nr:glycoside hydrolase family 79 protein [Phanerochaete carnosa HHB-10118-sp]EKM58753.1 glycoside hydrolase family 79 protein [Phanerochaete carnosa HHB-10118-sp]